MDFNQESNGINPQKCVRGYQDQFLLIALEGLLRCFRQNKITFTQKIRMFTNIHYREMIVSRGGRAYPSNFLLLSLPKLSV